MVNPVLKAGVYRKAARRLQCGLH